MQYLFIIDAISNNVPMSMFYNVQTTNLTFGDKEMGYTVNIDSIALFQTISHTKYNTLQTP